MQARNWYISFRSHVDASAVVVGGTLIQLDTDRKDQAVAFFSKRLSPAEENYSADNCELLRRVYFLKRFRCYLQGSEFEVVTDNQVLKYFFQNRT